jgi:Tfp pilus tip-associated adhesin PilY1
MPGNDGATTGNQFVNTMVIGFSDTVSSDQKATNYLKSLVTIEDKAETPERDGFFLANNQEELVKAFTDALTEIVVSARSQATPGYSVNVKNGLEHEDSVFIPVFEKMNSQSWRGNLKKFKLVNVNGHRRIRGKTPGVDAMTELGIFKDEAWDLWSDSSTADGKSVAKGGVSSLIVNPAQRKLFSNLSGDSNVNLWAADNLIKFENDKLTNALLNVGDASGQTDLGAYRQKLINFVRGWNLGDKTKGARKYMGDMLHSEPVIISYSPGDAAGIGKKQYIFASTNEGYLHAFDAETGEEKFAFMPKKLLKNVYRQYVGEEEGHIYGIDGNLTYVKDGNHVYLYFGLRRGGRAYYALDVTDITKPKLMWKVDAETDSDFSHLGQTWSSPYIANVLHGGKRKTAIVFTGGYDTTFDYEESGVYQPNTVKDNREASVGNDIYIVNAKTGEKLWSMRDDMQRTDVKHAIPGGVRILDTNKNGLLDRLYFADTGGNVWRLDLHEDLSSPTKSKLVKIAELASEDANRRKFFTEPDVARLTENGQEIFTISLGSGLRSHPLNEKITDHMFVLLEKSPLAPLKESGDGKYKTIKMTDLANIQITASVNSTSNTISKTLTHTGFKKGTNDVANITHSDKRGWYVKFPDTGEKVLSTSITFEGSLIFTSFVPKAITSGEEISVCSSPGTQGRIYAMNILTGEASININRDDKINDNDVFATISANEIPGKPQRIFNQLECSNGSCKHEVDIRIGKKGSEVGAKDVSKVESIYWNDPTK